jgi:hypothetical protein
MLFYRNVSTVECVEHTEYAITLIFQVSPVKGPSEMGLTHSWGIMQLKNAEKGQFL